MKYKDDLALRIRITHSLLPINFFARCNHLISQTEKQSKADKVRHFEQAIQKKCKNLSSEKMNLILKHINLSRHYFIQVTDNPQKFLNIIAAESIVTDDCRMISETTKIYGDFSPGRFMNLQGAKTICAGSIDQTIPAAAVKMSFGNRFFPNPTMTYTLVIYEPSHN